MQSTGRWLAVALAALVATGCGTKVSPEVSRLAEQLRQANRVEGEFIGPSGGPSEVFAVYRNLRDAATRQELKLLLDDRSPTVRVYAFRGLQSKHNEVDLLPIVLRRLADTERVSYQAGCIVREMAVADVLVEFVQQDLSEAQRRALDEALIHRGGSLEARRLALLRSAPVPSRHDEIRKLALHGQGGALVALARYRDERDVRLLLGKLKLGSREPFLAVAIFPHHQFFPTLVGMHSAFLDVSKSGFWRERTEYYRAVAAYRTPQAKKLLRSALSARDGNGRRKYIIEAAFRAIINEPCPEYMELLMAYWDDSPFPNMSYGEPAEGPCPQDRLLAAMWQRDPKATLRGMKKHLARDDAPNSYNAVTVMLWLAFSKLAKAEAIALLNTFLRVAQPAQIDLATWYVVKHKPESSVPILLQRLTTTDDGCVQIAAAEALLAYKRTDIRRKIRDLLAEGKIPENGWGRQAVRERLEATGEK